MHFGPSSLQRSPPCKVCSLSFRTGWLLKVAQRDQGRTGWNPALLIIIQYAFIKKRKIRHEQRTMSIEASVPLLPTLPTLLRALSFLPRGRVHFSAYFQWTLRLSSLCEENVCLAGTPGVMKTGQEPPALEATPLLLGCLEPDLASLVFLTLQFSWIHDMVTECLTSSSLRDEPLIMRAQERAGN